MGPLFNGKEAKDQWQVHQEDRDDKIGFKDPESRRPMVGDAM